MTVVGEPITCKSCGGIFEGPVTLPDGARLVGHVQGGPFCHPMAKRKVSTRPTPTVDPERRPMTDEERERREEAVRVALRRDTSWRGADIEAGRVWGPSGPTGRHTQW